MNPDHESIIQRRMERAREAFAAAEMLAEGGSWTATVNRLYYACFYAVSALLLRQGLSSSKHSGVRSFFNHDFVRTGRVPADLAHFYNDLFSVRQQGDYNDFAQFQEADVRPWIAEARRFVAHVEALLAEPL